MEKTDIETRALILQDVPFVHSSWIKSLVEHSGGTRRRDIADVVSLILQSCGGTALVSAETPDFILGYAVHEVFENRKVLHWIYLKHSFRRMGLGTELMKIVFGEKPAVSITMAPQPISTIQEFMKRNTAKWELNPYLLIRRCTCESKRALRITESETKQTD